MPSAPKIAFDVCSVIEGFEHVEDIEGGLGRGRKPPSWQGTDLEDFAKPEIQGPCPLDSASGSGAGTRDNLRP